MQGDQEGGTGGTNTRHEYQVSVRPGRFYARFGFSASLICVGFLGSGLLNDTLWLGLGAVTKAVKVHGWPLGCKSMLLLLLSPLKGMRRDMLRLSVYMRLWELHRGCFEMSSPANIGVQYRQHEEPEIYTTVNKKPQQDRRSRKWRRY
ncbi:hypothetical protein B0T20DRAFT_158664 [Sordaria brevicollis]|uniref:Uncharacterized protein n=1 Tax=Sordaria brevicollis TaxID=83679 RepID=A0AAE0PJ57_SORBR|nr:hypothetical protein B0T20DRAFT_158664 [Sordaria brevicollis]